MFFHKPALFFMIFLATAALALALCSVPVDALPSDAHASKDKIHAPYPDSARGLKQQFKDMRDVARKGRLDQLRAMITELQIPEPRTWYLANFGTPGIKTADFYGKNLARSEQDFENQMIEFAREDGYFSVKKQDSKKAYPNLVAKPEVFLAAWERISALGEDHSETPFGYFFFVQGKFRWDSTIAWVTLD